MEKIDKTTGLDLNEWRELDWMGGVFFYLECFFQFIIEKMYLFSLWSRFLAFPFGSFNNVHIYLFLKTN